MDWVTANLRGPVSRMESHLPLHITFVRSVIYPVFALVDLLSLLGIQGYIYHLADPSWK